MVCCFFGHRELTKDVDKLLMEEIRRLISSGVSSFLVGNQGQFDAAVLGALRKVANEAPWVDYKIVLAYMPKESESNGPYWETVLPEGIENVHPKYAIGYRNRWMLSQSDVIVAYVEHQWGGAARYVGEARRKGKCVINLFEKLR